MMLFPPTGLEYIATSAKGLVDKITLVDLKCETELSDNEKLLAFIKNEIDIVCVSIGWDRQIEEICSLLNQIPDPIPVIVGGFTATEKVDELFAACPKISIIIRGEGEETIREILKGFAPQDILGISYRLNGNINHNAHRPAIDVNAFPAPDRSLRRNDYSFAINGIKVAGLSFDTILTSRGCPYNCKFCTFSLNPLGQKRKYAERRIEDVVDEIAGIKAGIIMFSDDNIFTNPKRVEKLCDMLIKRKIKKRFLAQARIEIAKYPRLLEKIVKAGFKALLLGIESPHDWILKQLDKGFDQATIRASFEVLRKYPIFYNGYFIYGNIGETEEEMLYIAQFAKEIGVDAISCNKLRIEKFSSLRNLAEETPGYHISPKGELFSDQFSHAALKKIGKKIKFSFYSPLRYIRIFWKNIFIVKFFTAKELLSLLFSAPFIIGSVLVKEHKRGRLKESLYRTFVKKS